MTRDEFDEHVLRIQLDGYTVLPGLLTSDECEQARKELNSLSEKNMWLGNLFNKGQIFEIVYQIPSLLEVVRYFLGQDAVLSGAYGSILSSGAGGGGINGTEPFPSAPEAQSTPYAGGGYGGYATGPTSVKDGGDGVFGGGGGGAGAWGGGTYASGGNGGMGIVLIAYPT